MMTRRRLRCSPGPAEGLLALLCLPAGTLWAGQAGAALSGQDCQPLYAEVLLNDRRVPELAELCRAGEETEMTPQALEALGFQQDLLPPPQASGRIALSQVPGVSARYDPLRVLLTLRAPAGLLQLQRYSSGGGGLPPPSLSSPPLPGVLLNYSLYAARTEGAMSASGWSEWQMHGSDSWLLSDSQRLVWQAAEKRVIHLDTRLQRDFVGQALTLTMGDTVTDGPDWSRSTRITGLQLGRNFALQPESGTAPDALLTGQATLPSTVDIYINQIRQSTQRVLPGPFDIEGMPVRNGVNSVQMVVTDITGRQQVRSYSLYGASSLLRAGLSEGSLAAGVPRRSWGIRDFDVDGNPVFSASLRRGMTDTLTLEGHTEGRRQEQMAGAGFRWIPDSQAGLVSLAVAGSTGNGQLLSWGWERTSGPLSLSVSEQRVNDHFRDIATGEGAVLPRLSRQVFAGLNTAWGNPALGVIRQEDRDGAARRYTSLSWSWGWQGGSVSLTLNRQAGPSPAQSVALWLSVPLGREMTMNVSRTSARQGDSMTTSLSGRHDALDWRVSQGMSSGHASQSQAEVSQRAAWGDLSAGITQMHAPQTMTALYASASGSAVLLRQGAWLTPPVSEGYALVSTAGVPGIPVRLENNLAGVTDGRGYLLLNHLQPWQRNSVSLDVTSIGDNWTLGQTSREVVPPRHGGVLAFFDVKRNVSAELHLTDAGGEPLPAGGAVSLSGLPLTQVGHDGVVWLADPPSEGTLEVTMPGGDCQVVLTPALVHRAQKAPEQTVCRIPAEEKSK